MIICAALALLLLPIVLNIWLGTSKVEVTGDQVTVRRSLLGIGRSKYVPLQDVQDVRLKLGMSQSESVLQSPRAWYDIQLHRTSGRPVTLGTYVANKREAEWLVSELRRALRLD